MAVVANNLNRMESFFNTFVSTWAIEFVSRNCGKT